MQFPHIKVGQVRPLTFRRHSVTYEKGVRLRPSFTSPQVRRHSVAEKEFGIADRGSAPRTVSGDCAGLISGISNMALVEGAFHKR
jgi:hypothetical protein